MASSTICPGVCNFALAKNFGNPRTYVQRYPKFFYKYKSHTAITSVEILRIAESRGNSEKNAESALDSATRTQIAESATFCHSERSEESLFFRYFASLNMTI